MNHIVSSVLRFLFPEVGIIDVIKKEGFIAKKNSSQPSVSTRESSYACGENMHAVSSTTKLDYASGAVHSSSKMKKSPLSKSISANEAEQRLEGLEMDLRGVWVASAQNISGLCSAFKRPFIMGYQMPLPKSSFLLIGSESRGKMMAVKTLGNLLRQRKVLAYGTISRLDIREYSGDADNTLFINDLYKALYEQSDIVVFENIEYAGFSSLEILKQLLCEGLYHLPKRYRVQNGMLAESTGMLNTDSVSRLSANGKYFVFTSTTSEAKVADHLGNAFMQNIKDIIVLDALTQGQIREISDSLIQKFLAEVKNQLRFELIPETAFVEQIENSYHPDQGIKGLQKYINKELYTPLAEYRMLHPSENLRKFSISYDNGFFIKSEEILLPLSQFVKRYDEVEIENVRKELDQIIGLDKVKNYILNLENNLNVQNLRAQKGLKTASLSMHMIFTGNPGTGKTTIARIVAKYLKAIGVLSSGHLREVSRSDMVGQYVGQTARLTAGLIESAIGGVLFIDEAYSLCRGQNDVYGLEAIDALVKGMEDNRDNLVVILAGYTDEMAEFLKSNPGLKSRFPHVIEFEDYTPDEMYRIALVTAKGKGYVLDEKCKEPLLETFERKQIKGRNDSGNGRLVRNLIEDAILNQSQRIALDHSQDLELLTLDDFKLSGKKEFDLEKELSDIIGLENVKDFIRTQYHVLLAQEKRKKADLKVDTTQSLNMIFSGNPGTGKTTMARVVAGMFHSMGLLKSGHLVETDKGGLVAEYVGQTSKKTEDVFRSALGGVLFIDEAYAITNSGSNYGQECIDTLVKLIEDYRGEILVILAGYNREMNEFLKANSGLESRFPLKIDFPDYTADELCQIGESMIAKRGFNLNPEAQVVFKEEIYSLKRHSDVTSGNGRMVRNFVDEIVRKQSSRIALSDVTKEEMTLVLPQDITVQSADVSSYDLERDLEKVVGLDSVKNYIRSLEARLKVREERKKHGLKTDTSQTLHMIFMGNPGTGKTMMARTIANVLYSMGIIPSNKLIETDRSGLVAGYVGQTALKTREVIESAIGGVLFIDEAYSLAQGGERDFGQEAIDTLVKMMDDNRDRLVVILAGYYDDMKHFLEQNAGLQSRFPNVIEFEDYTTEELLAIAEKMYSSQGYLLDAGAEEKLKILFTERKKMKNFGNGRYVRNVYEHSLNAQAMRLSNVESVGTKELSTITAEDIREVIS